MFIDVVTNHFFLAIFLILATRIFSLQQDFFLAARKEFLPLEKNVVKGKEILEVRKKMICRMIF